MSFLTHRMEEPWENKKWEDDAPHGCKGGLTRLLSFVTVDVVDRIECIECKDSAEARGFSIG